MDLINGIANVGLTILFVVLIGIVITWVGDKL